MKDKAVTVTEPFLPPLEEYVGYLETIWASNQLTNQGPLVRELEERIQAYHRLKGPVACLANGGLGLQLILKALGLKGEILTTPFSYVATTSCPVWEGCRVKFADIEPDYLTLDPAAVEAAITPATEAVLATHVFGNCCDVEALAAIGERHGIPVIYDAAHAFGIDFKGRSVLEWGHASMVSLHATKLMHAVEGGFVVARDPATMDKVEWMRRFGHDGPDAFAGIGINAKLSELHAAMGLCSLNHIAEILERRKSIYEAYEERLGSVDWPGEAVGVREHATRNYSYCPILMESEEYLLQFVGRLEARNIHPRRYFYPPLTRVPGLEDQARNLPVTMDVSRRILCLPMSHNLGQSTIEAIAACLVS